MFLTGIGTAVPAGHFTQRQCWDAIQESERFLTLDDRSRFILRKVLTGENGIATRNFVFTDLKRAFDLTPDALDARFAEHAPQLAVNAACNALKSSRLAACQIDALVISTCTGYLCPGLTSYVAEELGLRHDIHALDLVGQGCGAALPNMRTAKSLLGSGEARHVLSICVEVCSAALYFDDDPGVLVSACLFADGAGAAVWSNEAPETSRRVEWISALSHHSPINRDFLKFEQRGGMLRNILGKQVPEIASERAHHLLQSMLEVSGLERSQITSWIMHAGGREVLLAMQKRLNLKNGELDMSTALLRELGNVSSPFVLFVLERALQQKTPGGHWWMTAFGAGFSCHGALLKVD